MRNLQRDTWIEIVQNRNIFNVDEETWENLNISNQVLLNRLLSDYQTPNKLQTLALGYLQLQEDLLIEGGRGIGKTLISLVHIINTIDNSKYLSEE